MCKICKEWKAGKLTDQLAYKKIAEALNKSKDSEEIAHLTNLSDIILDELLPVGNSNPEADEAWWKATHKNGEDNEE